MTAHKRCTWLVAGLLLCTSATPSFGQIGDWVDTPAHDLQFFSPVDVDFDNNPIQRECGYFFNFDKLSWAFTGERNTIGTADFSNASQNPWRNFVSGSQVIPDPNDPDTAIVIPGVPVTIDPKFYPSSIQSGPPRATFAWGERYEMGYFANSAGWLVGVLDGPAAVDAKVFGFGLSGQDDTVTDGNLGFPSPFPGAPNQLLSPFGSVLVVFDDPQSLMLGYLDFEDGAVGNLPGGSLENDSNGDGVLNGDGFADDINRNGQFGPDGYDTEDPGEIPDAFLLGGTPADLGDLVFLPTSWQTLFVQNTTETQGIEIMRTHLLDNKHRMAKHQNNVVELSYGARYTRLRDTFIVNGFGGVLGDSFWDTRITNNLVGPQIGLKLMHQRNRVRVDWSGRCLFGYNIQNWEQTAALGEDLIEGQHNHPLYFRPTYSVHGKQENDFSPVAEMRVQASYQFTSAISFKLGYNALFVDNIRRAAQQVKYELPSMGFRDGGTQEIFINGASFGFDVVY